MIYTPVSPAVAILKLNFISDTKCDFETDIWSNCGYRTAVNFDGLFWDRTHEKEIIGRTVCSGLALVDP